MGEEKRERYLVSTFDGHTHTVVADTFAEAVNLFGENAVWAVIKLYYDEEEGE